MFVFFLYAFVKQQQLQRIMSPWIKENHSQTQVICQTLAAAQQLTQQVIGIQLLFINV